MTKVSFICNHGVAADPVFEWLPRALAGLNDTFVYLGESVRSKYFFERKRNERPDVLAFEAFLKDVAGSYRCAVECFSYRAFRIHDTKFASPDTLVVNLLRDPLVWLHYYTNWRIKNCNVPLSNKTGIEHEWSVIDHAELESFGFSYSRSDVPTWAFLRGIQILNLMISDRNLIVKSVKTEDLFCQSEVFDDLITSLGSKEHTTDIFSMSKRYEYLRKGFSEQIVLDGAEIFSSLSSAQKSAVSKVLSEDSKQFFFDSGYTWIGKDL